MMRSQDYKNAMERVEVSEECRDRLLEKLPDVPGKDSNYEVNEPVEVVGKKQWYRRPITAVAASAVIAAGCIGGGYYGLRNMGSADDGKDNAAATETTPAVVEATDSTELSKYERVMIPLADVTDEWKSNVFFGSQFPYLIYGNEKMCVFTDGSDCVFVYDFKKRDIVFSCNVSETLENAAADDEEYGKPLISFCAQRYEGDYRIIATASYPESLGEKESRGYYIDMENSLLVQMDEPKVVDAFDTVDSPIEGVENLISNHIDLDGGGCIYLINNGTCDDVTPGNGSQLPMIDIIKIDEKYGTIDGYRPFENTNIKVDEDGDFQIIAQNDFKIKIPKEFKPVGHDDPSTEPAHYEMTLENGDIVCFDYVNYATYVELSGDSDISPEDAENLYKGPIFPDIIDNKELYGPYDFEDEVRENTEIRDCPFIYRKGKMLNRTPFASVDWYYHYEGYFGVVRCNLSVMNVDKAPAAWVVYTVSEDPDTLRFIHEVAVNAAE